MSKPLIYIVDDNDGFRQSVAFMLDNTRFSIQQFNCAEAALDKLDEVDAGDEACMLLDVRMPGLSGLDLHDRVNQVQPSLPIIYMTGHADVPLAVEAMKKGAITLLEKPLDIETLRNTVDSAIKSARKVRVESSADTTHSPASNKTPEEVNAERAFEESMQSLTRRESEVLESLVKGKTNKECAFEFDISVRTVEMHRARLLKKIGVRSGVDLIRAVLLHRAVP